MIPALSSVQSAHAGPFLAVRKAYLRPRRAAENGIGPTDANHGGHYIEPGAVLPSHLRANRIRAMFVRLSKTFHFEAAHDLPTFPDGHKCRRLHGHSFRFDVIVEGEVDPAKGYLIDYGDIKKAAEPLVKRLDQYYLNEIEGLSNPTSAVLAKWLWDLLK